MTGEQIAESVAMICISGLFISMETIIKNAVALPLSTVVCVAMVQLLLLKIPISQMGKTYRFIHPRPQEVCH